MHLLLYFNKAAFDWLRLTVFQQIKNVQLQQAELFCYSPIIFAAQTKKMSKQIRIVSILLFFTVLHSARATAQTGKRFEKRNTVYADAAIQGPVYSINYDRILSEGNRFAKTYRIGYSIYSNVLALPIGISFLSGKNSHHAELSCTLIPYIENYQKLFAAGNLSDKKLYLIPGAGYRYQKPTGGFFFKAVAAPVLLLDPPSDNFWKMDPKIYAGISIAAGISF